ncbi:MAG TPA: glycosyltransferase family 9 protein [Gammaproteobacteria bacterium]|nr:glycosyltransferase family 9 protein [Gammaproteobacteria bacterium]
MLAWPALALLRKNLPDAHIAVLVPAYTEPLARVCPSADEVIVDPKLKGEWRNGRALTRLIKPRQFDAVVTLFSRFDTALAAWLTGIPLRYAPATKLAQVFYNHRIPQRRSRSEKPEYEYNLDLVKAFLAGQGIDDIQPVAPPYLQFPDKEVQVLEEAFRREQRIPSADRLIFLHSGHGGSANNLSLEQYAALARALGALPRIHFVLTAGPGEEVRAQKLSDQLAGVPHSIARSADGLVAFAKRLQFAALFISGSTGPLHIAGALNRPTAAFYPRRRSSTALRWQTANDPDKRLAFMPPETAEESDMAAIDVETATIEIGKRFLK